MGHKVHQRQFTASTMHLVQNLLRKLDCSDGSRSFAKETRALKMRSTVASDQSWQWSTETIIETDSLTTTLEVAKKLNINHSTAVQNLKQREKVKRLDKWPAHQLTTNLKKSIVLKCRLLLFYATMIHFSIRLWCETKSIFYTTTKMTSAWTEKKLQSTSQSQTCTKKSSWSSFGGLLPVWSTTIFWIPAKSLHLRCMLSKFMRCTLNCNTCSWHRSTERVRFFSKTTSNHTSHNQCFRSWMNWARKFCLIHHIHLTSRQPTTTSSSISTTFCRENACTTRRRWKCLPRICWILKHRFLCYRNKQTFRRTPGEGNSNPLQYFCLGNSMDRGTWQAPSPWGPRVWHDLGTK